MVHSNSLSNSEGGMDSVGALASLSSMQPEM